MEFRFFEIYRDPQYLALLAEGMGTSMALTVAAGVLGFMLATLLALSRYWNVPLASQLSACFVEFFRNTPLIVQLFFFAFGLPTLLAYEWSFWAHALLALTLNFSAYFAEILRAGFISVSGHQNEAASALGIPPVLAFRKIVFPQAVAASFASLNSQFVFLFLTTGIISEIGVRDLTYAGLFIDSRTFRSFEVFITLTILYICLALALKATLTWIYGRSFPWRKFT